MGIAAAAEAATKSSSSSLTFLLLIVVVFVGFYMLLIRPQRRRQQQVQQQQKTVSPGATVRTTAGMYATVVDVDDNDVVLEVAPGVNVRYMKRAIMEVISSGDEVPDTSEADNTEYGADDATSAEDGLTDSHDSGSGNGFDDLASSNGTKAKSDSDAF
jgi:preprotein translocase subunit YajC